MPEPSISFIVTAENTVRRCETILDVFKSAMTEVDEVVVVTSTDRMGDLKSVDASWFRVVGVPDASVFTLRAHVPAVARRDWVVVLEEHSLVTPTTLAAIRRTIRERTDIDLVVFVAKNLVSTRAWEWANFLLTFAFAWAPVDSPPPFSPVTAVTVRRAALQTEAPLRDGEWELSTIPRLFASGRFAYSNEIFIDHVKPLSATEALVIAFHNARAGAGLSRDFARSRKDILAEGWYAFMQRPGQIAKQCSPRWHELPAGVLWRLHAIGFAHLVGNACGAFLGPGRSPHRLD